MCSMGVENIEDVMWVGGLVVLCRPNVEQIHSLYLAI
jgi:hypothetical protein